MPLGTQGVLEFMAEGHRTVCLCDLGDLCFLVFLRGTRAEAQFPRVTLVSTLFLKVFFYNTWYQKLSKGGPENQ